LTTSKRTPCRSRPSERTIAVVPIKHLSPTATTDRYAECAALADTSPFAQAFWATFGDDRRRDVLVAWATSGGAK